MKRHTSPAWVCTWLLAFGLHLLGNGAEPLGRVYRDKVQPHWSPTNSQFWYRVDVGRDQYEFILVNPEQGTRQTLFDHAKVANLLRTAGVKDARPDRLDARALLRR